MGRGHKKLLEMGGEALDPLRFKVPPQPALGTFPKWEKSKFKKYFMEKTALSKYVVI